MKHTNPQTLTPTDGERHMWERFSTALYQANRPQLAHAYRMAAAMRGPILLKDYDELMTFYRSWLLVGNLPPDRETLTYLHLPEDR